MFDPQLDAAHQTPLSVERKGACLHHSDYVSGRRMAPVSSDYLMLLLSLTLSSGYITLLSCSSSICRISRHLETNTNMHVCVQKKTAQGCRFLAMFTSRVYILSPLAPQTRKAKGPAFLFVYCLEADGKTGLRIKGKFKLL